MASGLYPLSELSRDMGHIACYYYYYDNTRPQGKRDAHTTNNECMQGLLFYVWGP